MYPAYYQTNFHYQTDGWMSDDSAKVYEVATESLFLGRQDAMQRSALVPLASWADETGVRGKGGAGRSLLEVGCGTGRLATFVRDNYPSLDMTLSDLSPFYLAAARENNNYWESVRGSVKFALGRVRYEQAKAEALPFPDQSFDVVMCVYLFHELPLEVRGEAMRQFARVLRPGGLLVITDSVQRGDRHELYDARLDSFAALNEPFYSCYVRQSIAELAVASGLNPFQKLTASVSKTLSFRKPL